MKERNERRMEKNKREEERKKEWKIDRKKGYKIFSIMQVHWE